MTKDTMLSLKQLNKLNLEETEETQILDFFSVLEKGEEKMSETDTEGLKVLVHLSELSNLYNVLREDKAEKVYTREELQETAPESYEGYWQVPRLVD
jgi:aspartyl/glutamyl-tRNA(Asn/Gln) amidotransferase C subunit